MLGVLVAERVAGGDATLGAVVEDGGDRSVELDRELARDRRLVQQLDPLDRGQLLARVCGALDQQLAELAEALASEPGEVDHRPQRVQRLGGADVVGRLLAADVLLAGLQGEDEAAAAVDVLGFAGDATRHAADQLLAGAEEAERGTAEVEAVAERLALAEGDVGAALARRLEDPERHRVGGDDQQGAVLLRRGAERLDVLDRAEEVGALEDHRGGLAVDRGGQGGGVGQPALEPDLDDLRAVPHRVGGERLAAVRVDAAGDDEALAPGRAHRQVAGGGDRGGPLVEAGVGDRQPGQLRHRRLELEHHLQPALGDLRLVGRVRGEELRARGDRVDDRRHVVVVHPRPDEADLRFGVGVARRQRREALEDLGLAEAVGDRQRPAEPQRRRDLLEEVGGRVDADRVEHLGPVVRGGGRVAGHAVKARGLMWVRRVRGGDTGRAGRRTRAKRVGVPTRETGGGDPATAWGVIRVRG